MTIYIALLRGINVGGKNKMKMDELRKLLESLGLKSVQTYIQSGNVVFESEEDADALQEKLESEILRVFGFSVPVIIRTANELALVKVGCPFSEEEISEADLSSVGESLYVAFLEDVPNQVDVDRLDAFKSEYESYHLAGRDIYLLFGQSIRNSKLATNLQKLSVAATVRNWKTVNKIASMVEGIKE
ncbi:DUF1697 domain-containing protein [Bacillus salitolerans]|uniref:DUF1697 domain-containing protein n=1 Tax=Bacillus salitolerans TaxID=1437434 RepID=A0ABW4LWM2_9BACI